MRRRWVLFGLISAIGGFGLLAPAGAVAHTSADPPPPGPGVPKISDLPGAGAIPDISQTPGGGPQVQGATNGPQDTVTDPAVGGAFSSPFAEPGPACPNETNGSNAQDTRKDIACKPAAVSVVVLPGGKLLYWDGLEGEERIKYSIVGEFGETAANDQSRTLDLSGSSASWAKPTPPDGGADAVGRQRVPRAQRTRRAQGDPQQPGKGSARCSAPTRCSCPTGRSSFRAGRDYYSEPHLPGTGLGVAELQGLRNTRIYDPRTNRGPERRR